MALPFRLMQDEFHWSRRYGFCWLLTEIEREAREWPFPVIPLRTQGQGEKIPIFLGCDNYLNETIELGGVERVNGTARLRTQYTFFSIVPPIFNNTNQNNRQSSGVSYEKRSPEGADMKAPRNFCSSLEAFLSQALTKANRLKGKYRNRRVENLIALS